LSNIFTNLHHNFWTWNQQVIQSIKRLGLWPSF